MDLKNLIHLEDMYLQGNRYPDLGWEYHELGLTPGDVRKLLNDGMIRIAYKSNKHTGYLVNREAVQKQLLMQQQLHLQFEPTDSADSDLFGSVYGYDDLKTAILTFIRNGRRGGFLMIGPPASAKSLFLMEISRLPGSMYITASNTTRTSLRDILMEDEPKYLCIDELDKASARDYDTLLSLLETGIVQRNTHYGRMQKLLTTQVYAAANRDHMPPEIKSRFVVIHMHAYTVEQLMTTGLYVLTKREHIPDDAARNIVNTATSELDIKDVRDYIKIARMLRDTTSESIRETIKFIKKYSTV